MREVATRKAALSGGRQIDFAEYPRMTYVISMATRRNLNLAGPLRTELASLVARCVRSPEYTASQKLAEIWIAQGIESVIFPSATGTGENVVVYLANAGSKSVAVRNRERVLAALRKQEGNDERTEKRRT